MNDTVFVRTGFPATEELLTELGCRVVAIAADEAAKVDGGLSCLSLRFNRSR